MKTNENKKNKGVIVLIITLCLIIVGLVGYISYDKFYVDKKTTVEIKELNQKLASNEKNIKESEFKIEKLKKSNSTCQSEVNEIKKGNSTVANANNYELFLKKLNDGFYGENSGYFGVRIGNYEEVETGYRISTSEDLDIFINAKNKLVISNGKKTKTLADNVLMVVGTDYWYGAIDPAEDEEQEGFFEKFYYLTKDGSVYVFYANEYEFSGDQKPKIVKLNYKNIVGIFGTNSKIEGTYRDYEIINSTVLVDINGNVFYE